MSDTQKVMIKAIALIDSFKGCLTSSQAGKAAIAAFQSGEAASIPVSDGGEGFSTIMTEMLGGSFKEISCSDPLGRPIKARYGLLDNGETAIIETAEASGLGLLSREERNPLQATSYGTGELILDALKHGAKNIWLGLGGSATCDGGTGLLQALGYRFLCPEDEGDRQPLMLKDVRGIDATHRCNLLSHCRITGFYDVSVPFCGPEGAAMMFAPQKGATPAMAKSLDKWMTKLCKEYSKYSGKEIMNIPGAGAAGGIGGAIVGVLGAEMALGVQKVLDIAGLDSLLSGCNLIFTGEGKADIQTLKGKVPMGILEYVRAHTDPENRPKIVLIAGLVSDRQQLLDAGFDAVLQITPAGMPLSEAMIPATAIANITRTIKDYLLC